MRVFFGIVLGAMLTVGVALVADTWTSESGSETSAAQHRTMVNWDVVGENVRVVHRQAREVWSRLSHKVAG